MLIMFVVSLKQDFYSIKWRNCGFGEAASDSYEGGKNETFYNVNV